MGGLVTQWQGLVCQPCLLPSYSSPRLRVQTHAGAAASTLAYWLCRTPMARAALVNSQGRFCSSTDMLVLPLAVPACEDVAMMLSFLRFLLVF